MQLQAIQSAIEELETANGTIQNVEELAYLYIVRDHLENRNLNVVERELNDVLPQYRKYCTVKREYQMSGVGEDAVVRSMQRLCQEIREFVQTLYSHTDMNKERRQIRALLESLYSEYVQD